MSAHPLSAQLAFGDVQRHVAEGRPHPRSLLRITPAIDQDLTGTPFKGHKKLKINTHCGERSLAERTKFGRVANQVSPAREELAYRIVRALDVPTYQTRLANITWVDPEAGKPIPGPAPAAGFVAPPPSMIRNALFIESTDDAAQRFVKEGLLPQGSVPIAVASTTNVDTAPMDQNRIAAIQLAEASIGNYDWFFERQGGTGQKALWNIDLFGVPTQVLPILQDFDLSNIVTLRTTAAFGVGSEMGRATTAFPSKELAPIAVGPPSRCRQRSGEQSERGRRRREARQGAGHRVLHEAEGHRGRQEHSVSP